MLEGSVGYIHAPIVAFDPCMRQLLCDSVETLKAMLARKRIIVLLDTTVHIYSCAS